MYNVGTSVAWLRKRSVEIWNVTVLVVRNLLLFSWYKLAEKCSVGLLRIFCQAWKILVSWALTLSVECAPRSGLLTHYLIAPERR
jgi:hypothetical protein